MRSDPRTRTSQERTASFSRSLAGLSFGLFLLLTLGANSVAATGGPLSWWAIWALPVAGGDLDSVGVVTLLPLVSLGAWFVARRLHPAPRTWTWGPVRIAAPVAFLFVLAITNILLQCPAGSCSVGSLLRVLLLGAGFTWVYLFTINERPNLLPILAGILFMQAVVALGQFFSQGDLGLRFLGEPVLDPSQSGISVVMNGSERWLRGYGLTVHPNTAARTLVSCLLMLLVLRHQAGTSRQRFLWRAAFLIGLAGLLVTLSRWAWACFLLGAAIAALPAVRRVIRHGFDWRRSRLLPVAGLLALAGLIFAFFYGQTVAGRIWATDSAVEARSIWERQRDLSIALRLLAEHPWNGVGFGRYLAEATKLDVWAETVHNVPLFLGAELGLAGLAAWLLLLVAPVSARGALGPRASQTGLWVGFWCLGLLYVQPNPLGEVRSTLFAGLAAALVAWLPALASGQESDSPVAALPPVGYH